jgi:hypothetical protein
MSMEINLDDTVAGIVGQVTAQAKSRGFRAANELRNAALQVLRGQRSGRIYKRPHSSSTYTASAPGEPPAVRTGGLRVSWKQQARSEKDGKTVKIRPAIWTDKKYAPILQEGTHKMAPRPFEEPIIEKAKPKVMTIFGQPYNHT